MVCLRTIFTNGRFYTFDESIPKAEAVVVEEGRFIAIGSEEEIKRKWLTSETEVVDLEGQTVIPGFTDSHLHLCGIASQFLNLDLTGVTSKKEMFEKIQNWQKPLTKGEWIIGRGWDENLFTEDSIPTIEELDKISPNHPLYLSRICGHAFLVNSKALEMANYHKDIEIPEGGTIVLDDEGEPTGLLLEQASQLITRFIPEPSYDHWKEALRKAIKFVIQKGITSVHTNDPRHLGGLDQTWQLYDELINDEQLGLRCNLLIDHEYLDELKEKGMFTGYGNEFLQIGAIKIFADGALGRRTALLSEPYADAPETHGDAMYSKEELRTIIKKARSLNMPVAVHTIGDKALENILDILDEFPEVFYRDRLIHVQVLREDLIKRLKTGNRIVDIQPRFLAGDFPWVIDRLGKERSKRSYAWKTLIDAEIVCAGGSDCPVEPVDPLLGIHAAVTRRSPNEGHEGYHPKEKLTMEEAFKLFTKMGAYPTNEETKKGTLSLGKFADMTVFEKDPFILEDPDEILEMDVSMTIVAGKIRYQK